MSDQEFIIAPPTVKVGFTILPVDGVINSMALLNQVGELSGFADWAYRTYDALPEERRHFNELFFTILMKGIHLSQKDMPEDFNGYIQYVASQDPQRIRQGIGEMFMEKASELDVLGSEITIEHILTDSTSFKTLTEALYKAWHAKKSHDYDETLLGEAFELLQTPQAMQQKMVEHLEYMWDKHLRDEWNRNLPILEETVAAFSQLNLSGKTFLGAIEAVTGRDMSEYWEPVENITTMMFVPSAHVGPYNAFFVEDSTAYVFFGARKPEGVQSGSQALNRSELLVRLNALADDTRLTILELLTRQEEICAQDIINQLELSQSSASRHLRQLTATGYLKERRREVAKCYTLNEERVQDTLIALRQFLRMG